MSLPDLAAVLWRQRDLLERLVYRLECEHLLLAAGRTRFLALATAEVERLLDEWVVHEALLRLSADQRTVLLRTFYGGERYSDVASDLHIPEATARTRAFYGLRALRATLVELGWER